MRCDFLRYTKYLCENTPFYISQSLVEASCQLNRCFRSLHGVAPDRVYIVKPMFPWAGWALTPPFHPYCCCRKVTTAVYLCCTCPEVTLGGRYPLSLPCGARTFLTCGLSACSRGCPTWLLTHCTAKYSDCQMSCKLLLGNI